MSCLIDNSNCCHFLHLASTESRPVTTSMPAAEVYAFSRRYEYGISVKIMLKELGVMAPLSIFTDAKSIFDTINAPKRMCNMRVTNDMADIRRAYRINKIENVDWVRSSKDIADNFTRHIQNNILMDVMRTGHLDFVSEQWVFKEIRK